MELEFEIIEGVPEVSKLTEILELHNEIFNSSFPTNGFLYEVEHKKNLLFNLAYDNNQLVGFKIGYEQKQGLFYSWLGGVKNTHRKKGIALRLMSDQHAWLQSKNFQRVKTKTGNEFKEMLILNLRQGFNITGTNINNAGQLRLILQKPLT